LWIGFGSSTLDGVSILGGGKDLSIVALRWTGFGLWFSTIISKGSTFSTGLTVR